MPREPSRPDSNPVLIAIAELREENRAGRAELRDDLASASDLLREDIRSVRTELRQHSDQDDALFRKMGNDSWARHEEMIRQVERINGARETEQRALDRQAEREFFRPPTPPAGFAPAPVSPPEGRRKRESFWPRFGRELGRTVRKYVIHAAVAVIAIAATTAAHRCGAIGKLLGDGAAPSGENHPP